MSLHGPLLGLSLRRCGHHMGARHTPHPPTNEERRRAWDAVKPLELANAVDWSRQRYGFGDESPTADQFSEAFAFKYL